MRPSECPKCQGTMAQGFVLDNADQQGRKVSSWIEGAPEQSFWSGLKLGDRRQIEIESWRCGHFPHPVTSGLKLQH